MPPRRRAARGSVPVSIWQQRQESRALDRGRELALIDRARAGDPARDDLARLGDVLLERRKILVIDLLDAFRGEAAKLLASKIACHRASPRFRRRLGRFLS